jgi:FKBP-type peptidyl-prolyl cis-trans isomerase FklB
MSFKNSAVLAVFTAMLALAGCGQKSDTATTGTYDLSPASNTKFLADNKAKDGVKTTADGLQYRVIHSGSGKKVTNGGDQVTVTYKGWTIDGHVFDQTQPGATATFPAGGLIPGWVEALRMMHEGDEWELVIPSEIGYGAEGAGADIGPNQTLVFDMTLVSVQPVPPPQ